MRKPIIALLLLLVSAIGSYAEEAVVFDDYFLDQALRVDCTFVGDAKEQLITVDRIVGEGAWPENKAHLIDHFNYGRYAIKVYDVASNTLIYSRGFDSMFGEYRTTSPAIAGVKRSFPRPLRFPLPKRSVLFVVESRDKNNLLHSILQQPIDPADYHIIKETPNSGDLTFTVQKNGDPHEKVDLAFIAEGYTSADGDKFKADVERFTGYLFAIEPYASAKSQFNVYGVLRPSPERGMDEPRQGAFKKTALNSSFNAFDLDRYQLTEEGRTLREIAAQVPYDTLVILVNSERYGGGGIYNDYCITTVDHQRSKGVFLHEFGHSFAGLADEYYLSDVSYNDFYPKGVEPLEPNITAFMNPDQLKWKDMLAPGLTLPTDWGKDTRDAQSAERQNNRKAMREEVEHAKKNGVSAAAIAKIEEKYKTRSKEIDAQSTEVRKKYSHLEDKVGLFEGAGYSAKGLYRPMIYCIMISNPKDEFCRVCQRAISRMISTHSGQ